jgi:hypothetical protein
MAQWAKCPPGYLCQRNSEWYWGCSTAPGVQVKGKGRPPRRPRRPRREARGSAAAQVLLKEGAPAAAAGGVSEEEEVV